MVEEKKTAQQQADEKVASDVARVEKRDADVLSAAAASGDAAVHQLLGERVVAEQNGDVDALKEIDKKLGELLK